MVSVVRELRRCRVAMVQSEAEYRLCHTAMLAYAEFANVAIEENVAADAAALFYNKDGALGGPMTLVALPG